MIHELKGKVVKAAQKLHQELIDSAAQLASTTFVQNTANISNVSESPLPSPDGAEEPEPAFDQWLANLKERQRKRLESASVEENRPQRAPKSDVFASLPECNNWLQALPSQEMLQNKPLQQVHKAIAVLQGRSCRQQRKDVKQLLKTWGVVQRPSFGLLWYGPRPRSIAAAHQEIPSLLGASGT